MVFFFILIMVYSVLSLELPRWCDSNENTEDIFMLKKIETISILCLPTSSYDEHSLARTTPVSNIFSWSQRCSSHWSSTVLLKHCWKKICKWSSHTSVHPSGEMEIQSTIKHIACHYYALKVLIFLKKKLLKQRKIASHSSTDNCLIASISF